MKTIIESVSPELLEQELNENTFARKTNNIGNELYIFSAEEAPNAMKEIGRLRELTFRQAGGGTGKEADIDHYDLDPKGFKQLVVWDPELRVIVGGYRFALGNELPKDEHGHPISPTSHLFQLSDEFLEEYLPKTIELGRSFVQPVYQSTGNAKKSIFALDNLWDGLGLLVVDNPTYENFFGKFTMYKHYPVKARDAILYFLKTYFPDKNKYVFPKKALPIEIEDQFFKELFTGNTTDENYKILNQFIRSEGAAIPPLVNAYMKLSPSMKSFGTSLNPNFGNVEETGIFIHIPDIYESKKKRHISNIDRNFKR
jgi:hypothetical protein